MEGEDNKVCSILGSINSSISLDDKAKSCITDIKRALYYPPHVFILYEDFSSFLLHAPQAMLNSSVSVFTPKGNLNPWDKSNVHKSLILIPEDRFFDSVEQDLNSVVLLEGSFAFIRNNIRRLCHDKIVILISGSTNLERRHLRSLTSHFNTDSVLIKSRRLSHKALGGVTSQFRTVIFIWKNNNMSEGILNFSWEERNLVSRSLYDFIEDHIKIDSSMEVSTTTIAHENPNDFEMTTSALLGEFILPSIWSSSGWVRRSLSEYEIMNLLDITQLRRPLVVARLSELIKNFQITSGKICQNIFLTISRLCQDSHAQTQQEIPMKTPDSLVVAAPEEGDPTDWETDYLISYGQRKAKEDDAPVPIEIWDRRCISVFSDHFDETLYKTKWSGILNRLRQVALKRYRRNLFRSFIRYLNTNYDVDWKVAANQCQNIKEDLKVGRDAIARAVNASWWEWTHGSTLFFWRWPKSFICKARDGVPIFVEKQLPRYKSPQNFRGMTIQQQMQMKEKLQAVVDKGYIKDGYVSSLTSYFAVPKGETDIRMVYDGTKCGLNNAVFAPNFFLPSLDSLFNQIGVGYWFSDFDLGEMFLNYFIHPSVRPYCGVDLTKIFESKMLVHKRWERTYMGFTASPYNATQAFSITLDVIRGNPMDVTNPFAWDRIKRNLPGMQTYDPALPWIMKMNVNEPAADLDVYVDDGRPFAPSRNLCTRAGQRSAQIIQYLGQQVAARKYIPPSQTPGPWCGAFLSTRNNSLWVYVSQDKWSKGRNMILELFDSVVTKGIKSLNHKKLEKYRGFLVHLARTYPSFVPYLKGIHLTLESWRPDRDEIGWKLRKQDTLINSEGESYYSQNTFNNIPQEVEIVPRLFDDLSALMKFFTPEKPPWRFIRGKLIAMVQYGFGDASKAGFGASLGLPGGDIWVRSGTWSQDEKNASSNFRELSNLVETLEQRAESNLLQGLELFIFTDNSAAEGAFYKGTSSSRLLFELVLRLRQLELHQGCKIHFIHVAGTRMIAQGTDGISRGDMQEGVLSGATMLSFVPLHLSCIERCTNLIDWFRTWLPNKANFLEPKDWFFKAHNISGGLKNEEGIWIPEYSPGVFVWTPSPPEGMIAIEQMRRARTKHTDSTHVFIVPRLFTSLWRKQLNKIADVIVQLPFNELWTHNTHFEPLILAVVFPFVSFKPWQLKRSNAFLGMERHLRTLLTESSESQRHILCKLFKSQRCLATLSSSVAWKVLQSSSGFLDLHSTARGRVRKRVVETEGSGSIHGKDPDSGSTLDTTLLKYIRRVNLDGMWSRAPSTVRSNLKAVEDTIQMLKELGLDPSFPALGPWPLSDQLGFKLVIAQIRFSQRPGRNQNSHLQFDTVRKLRTAFSHISEISVDQLSNPVLSFRSQDGKLFTNSSSVTQGRLFEKCTTGMLLRMGRQTTQNIALSYKILHLILGSYEKSLLELQSSGFNVLSFNSRGSSNYEEYRHIVMHACVFLFGFVFALRGSEIFLIEAGSLVRHSKKGLNDKELGCHLVVPLLGRFKGEDGERFHLLFSVSITSSGFQVRKWMERLVTILEIEISKNPMPGPAFTDIDGSPLNTLEVDHELHKQLILVQTKRPDLIEASLDISEHYSVFRSLRRGSTSRAAELKLPDSVINLHNRWRARESSGGQVPRGQMKDYYTDLRLTGKARLEYTKLL